MLSYYSDRISTLDEEIDELNDKIESRERFIDALEKEESLNEQIKKAKEDKKEAKKVINKENGNGATKAIATVGIVVLAGALATGVFLGTKKCAGNNCSKKNNTKSSNTSVLRNSEATETPVVTNNNGETFEVITTEAPVVTAEPTIAPVIADFSNEEDAKIAADKAYNEITPMLESEDDMVLNFNATRENIEDMIRVLNGELPINSGFNNDTLDKMIQMNANIFANRGHVDNELYDLKYETLFEEGTLLALYAKSYDDIYAKIHEYRKEGNIDGFVEEVGLFLNKIYNEWYLAGLNGGFDPYEFEDSKQYLAFLAATSRIDNFMTEYIQNIRMFDDPEFAICIPTCYNENGEQVYRSFEEIVNGLYTGKSFDGEVILKRNNELFLPWEYAYNNLNNTLLEKSEAQTKVLR